MSAAATANGLREVAADITRRCRAGDFGHAHSLLRARMDAHAVRLWVAATEIDENERRVLSRREIQGASPCHRVALWLRQALGLRRGVRL